MTYQSKLLAKDGCGLVVQYWCCQHKQFQVLCSFCDSLEGQGAHPFFHWFMGSKDTPRAWKLPLCVLQSPCEITLSLTDSHTTLLHVFCFLLRFQEEKKITQTCKVCWERLRVRASVLSVRLYMPFSLSHSISCRPSTISCAMSYH